MNDTDHRCRSCNTPLAADNTGDVCGQCEVAERHEAPRAPDVSAGFWEDRDMQAALLSRHMGKVIRAYRQHRHHGYRGISQSEMAAWTYTSQGQISRLENGPEPADLRRLFFWARLLGIPQRYLWFELPEHRDPETITPPSPQVHGGEMPAEGMTTVGDSGHPRPHLGETGRWDAGGELGADDHETREAPGVIAAGSDIEDAQGAVGQQSRDANVRAPLSGGTGADVRSRDAGVSEPALGDVAAAPTLPNPPIHIDIYSARPARIADYLSGGNANFEIDRNVTEYVTGALPGGSDTARRMVSLSQNFHARVVRYLAGDVGLSQFLDMGTSMPMGSKLHQVTQGVAPGSRVVSVISDDVLLAHARRLWDDTSQAAFAYIRGSLRDTEKLLAKAAETLDLDRPVAVLGLGAFNQLDDETAHRGLTQLFYEVVSGSYLAIANLAADLLGEGMAEAIRRHEEMVQEAKMPALALRTRTEVARLFDGLELVEPGVVPVDQWRPDLVPPDAFPSFIYGAVGYKP